MKFEEALRILGFNPFLIEVTLIIGILLLFKSRYRTMGYGLLMLNAIPFNTAYAIQNQSIYGAFIIQWGLIMGSSIVLLHLSMDYLCGERRTDHYIEIVKEKIRMIHHWTARRIADLRG
jgi:hypothetical protein